MSELLVVGGTSGLGLEFVKARISAGDKVVVVSRKEFKLNGVTSIICDLSDAEEVGLSIKGLLRSKLNFDSLLFFQRSRKGSYEDSWQSEFDVAVSSTRQFLQSSQSMLRNDGDKSIVIVSFALCGFANFSSIAIQVGGIGELAPNRRADLAKLGFKALICGTLASYLSATIAGLLL